MLFNKASGIGAKSGVKSISNPGMGNEFNDRQTAQTSEETLAGAGALRAPTLPVA